jgi:poly(3-hydroxybutyrate) depolymerase
LVNGTWDVKNLSGKTERVRPGDIKTTALLSVEGELDDISGSGQTRAVHEICTGVPKDLQRHFEAVGAGHYGIFSGRRWREHVYPFVKSFILDHNTTEPATTKTAKAISTAAKAQPVVLVAKPVAAKKPVAKRAAVKK